MNHSDHESSNKVSGNGAQERFGDKLNSRFGIRFGAVVFLVVNILGGGFHYLYQLLAARILSPVEFGSFSGWTAWVYIGLAGGAVAQYGANFFPLAKNGIKNSLIAATIISAVVISFFLFANSLEVVGIGWIAILIAPFACWLLGQTQRRMLLITFALGGLIIGIAKVALVLLAPAALSAAGISMSVKSLFYWALPMSYVAGIAFVAPVLLQKLKQPLSGLNNILSHIRLRWIGAVVLSFSSVFIPNVDLVYVKFTQSTEALTQFAQVSLFYKIVFFVILIMAQWLLPQQLNRSQTDQAQGRRMKVFVRVCALGLMFALCASTAAPQFYRIVLNKEFLAPILWVFMSCFNVALLTGIFLELQNQIAGLKITDALACLVIQLVTVLLAVILNLDLGLYLQVQIAVNSMLLFILLLGAGRILSRQVVK